MPAAPDTKPGSAAADAARASRNRHRRARMLWMIAGSHAVDTIALTAFCLIGTTPWLAAGVHAVAWGGIVGAFGMAMTFVVTSARNVRALYVEESRR